MGQIRDGSDDHARSPSFAKAIASFGHGIEPELRDQSENGSEVAQAGYSGGPQNRAEGAAFNCSQRKRGGDHHRVPAAPLLALDDCLFALQPTIPHLT